MTIYFSIYITFFVVSLFIKRYFSDKENNAKNLFCFISFVVLTLIFALRHPSMGHDLRYLSSNGYLGSFDYIATVDWKSIFDVSVLNYERGYIIFNKIVSSIWNNQQFFLAICALLTIAPIAWTIAKESESAEISFVIYMGLPAFLMSYSGLRQALAIGICFFSIYFIKRKKLVWFVVLSLLAASFHYSAIVFIISYPLYHFKMKDTLRYVSIFIIPIFYIFRYQLFTIFSKILKEDASLSENSSGLLFVIFSLVYVFCIIYTDGSDEQNGFMNLFFVACLCQSFGDIFQTAMRVGYYFMTSLILLLPPILLKQKINENKYIYIIIVVISFAVFGLYSIYRSTWAEAYPYYFFWEQV